MKTCKNCQYYTGVQCHGHGDYYGLCLKKKERIIVDDDTPCLQNLKTLRKLYYESINEIENLDFLMNYKIPLEEVEKLIAYGEPQQDK